MRVLFWVPYPTEGPSNRYRVEQYLPYLDREGIEYSLHSFWCKAIYKSLHRKGNYIRKISYFLIGLFKRLSDLFKLKEYDIVFIHREASPFRFILFENIAKFLNKYIIFDFDDSIFLHNISDANKLLNFLKNPQKVPRILKLSDLLIAGNSFLKNYATNYNNKIIIIPTVIDTEKYVPKDRIRKDGNAAVIIGWIGSPTTIKYLDLLKDVFEKLIARFDNIKVHIVGGKFGTLISPSIINKEWELETEVSDLQEFDIGIMPIPDDNWGRGKCAFKIIQYMSVGIPVVASSVGMNKEVVINGINGFLAENNDDWLDKLSQLIRSADLRSKLGAAGRITVENNYSLKSQADNFTNILKGFNKDKRCS